MPVLGMTLQTLFFCSKLFACECITRAGKNDD